MDELGRVETLRAGLCAARARSAGNQYMSWEHVHTSGEIESPRRATNLGAVETVGPRKSQLDLLARELYEREQERTHMVWHRYSENGFASCSSRFAVWVSRESATQRYACIRTAGPRYWSWFHQYDGHEVEQHAHRMHYRRERGFCVRLLHRIQEGATGLRGETRIDGAPRTCRQA